MHPSTQPVRVDEDAILADIERLTRIESPTSHAAGVDATLDAVAALFEGTGAVLSRQPTSRGYGDILAARAWGGGRPGILVLAHVDTVHPLGTIEAALPFRREGDKVYGPGVFDMKGGLVLAVAAFRALALAGRATPLPITFLFTPDEEVGSPVSRAAIEAHAARAAHVLVVEPARDGGRVVTARKGVARFEVTTHGRPAHAGSNHEKGASAIRAMARHILAIEAMTDYARGVTTSVGLVRGGTGVNVVPARCEAEVDLRVPDDALAREMVARVLALAGTADGVETRVTGGLNRPPFARDAGIDGLFEVAAGVARGLGFALESAPQVGGGSDGNFTVGLGVPTLDGLGVEGAGAHTLEEHMLVSSIVPRTRLMMGLMEALGADAA